MEQLTSGQVDTEAIAAVLPQVVGFLLYELAFIAMSIGGLILLISRVQKFTFLPAEEELPKGQVLRCVYLRPGYLLFVLVCAAVFVYNFIGIG